MRAVERASMGLKFRWVAMQGGGGVWCGDELRDKRPTIQHPPPPSTSHHSPPTTHHAPSPTPYPLSTTHITLASIRLMRAAWAA